jgi:Family of unknown function (DUF6505)
MQFLRSIRLDASDTRVFHRPAGPGEWSVPGSFALLDFDPHNRDPKLRESFRHGFVGIPSFGYTSLVSVADISPAELAGLIECITDHLCTCCGAPTRSAARNAAEEEVGFTLEIAAHPVGTLITVERELTDEGIGEAFRTVSGPAGVDHSRVRLWAPES